MVRAEVQIACGMCRSKAHLLAAHDETNTSSEAASTFECPSVHVGSVIVIIIGNGEVKRFNHILEKSSAESCVQLCVEIPAHHKLETSAPCIFQARMQFFIKLIQNIPGIPAMRSISSNKSDCSMWKSHISRHQSQRYSFHQFQFGHMPFMKHNSNSRSR